VICPYCKIPIAPSDINVSAELALCRRCGNFHNFQAADVPELVSSDPPPDAWFKETPTGFQVGCSARRYTAFQYVPLAIGSLALSIGFYGFPLANEKFDLIVFLLGLPIVLGALILIAMALLRTCGTISVEVENNDGTIFTGVGGVGWRRHFAWNEVVEIRESINDQNRANAQLVLQSGRKINFAHEITPDRIQFLLTTLRTLKRGKPSTR
jgi:hypothetical protein